MASSKSLVALEGSVDVPFNVWLCTILVGTYLCVLHAQRLLLLVVIGVSTIIILYDRQSTVSEMTKTICVLPLGLGVVLAFLVVKRPTQTRLLSKFTTYVNFAVYGNIIMMVAAPTSGTYRGIYSKIACIVLFIWIVQQGRRVQWKTVRLHDRLFVFTAVSNSWIYAHGIYRFVLMTLPCFGSGRRHCFLELYSLGMTCALAYNTGYPFEYCFGMADTLVAAITTGWSSIATTFELVPTEPKQSLQHRFDDSLDICCGAASLTVALFGSIQIARLTRQDLWKR